MPRDITTATTLGDIAARWPELIEYMESRELDYCCGGSQTVAQAADKAGISPEELADDLRSFEDPNAQDDDDRDWSAASMTELADHIEQTHHTYVRRTLDRLDELSERCVQAHAEADPRLHDLREEILAFAEDMHGHMVREERVLFPWLRRLEKPASVESGPPWSVRRPIDCMLHDHDDAAGALGRVRALTDNFTPPDNVIVPPSDLNVQGAVTDKGTSIECEGGFYACCNIDNVSCVRKAEIDHRTCQSGGEGARACSFSDSI